MIERKEWPEWSDMDVAEGGPDAVRDFLAMFHGHSSWLVPVQYVNLLETLEWEEPPPIVKQVLRHVRAGQMRICRDLISRITGGSVLTYEAPEFVPPVEEPTRALPALPGGQGEVPAVQHGGPGRGCPSRGRPSWCTVASDALLGRRGRPHGA
ncbi:hypothetical protein [Kitasatospora sp. NPDC008115]|uniref:hypothetical protein n=1 Tax=Kitasatospora sp. NPDC008115 TaxID=3364022 RepID=UPI0036ECA763